jgi:hypothetical protein
MRRGFRSVALLFGFALALGVFRVRTSPRVHAADNQVVSDAQQMILEGRRTFRFDTFGDEKFWGDTLMLHRAVEGAKFGGIGAGLSPTMALALGLKVDSQALPPGIQGQITALESISMTPRRRSCFYGYRRSLA